MDGIWLESKMTHKNTWHRYRFKY